MIYMVEMDLADRCEETAWHAWYLSHIGKLLTVPGFEASQRFVSVHPTMSPFLALHEVASADVFTSAAYRTVGGPSATGKWQARMTNWQRNLLDGLVESPDVGQDELLIVLNDQQGVPGSLTGGVVWLTGVGLDRSVNAVGLAVVNQDLDVAAFAGDANVCCYKPLTKKLRAADI